jgi:8-oxo-dGTP diphosphatase
MMSPDPIARARLLVVAAALIDSHGAILVQQRPKGRSMAGLWEYPGGKVERSETPKGALKRELLEELDITVEERDLIPVTFASETLEDKELLLLLFVCRRWVRQPEALHATQLRWVDIDALATLAMPPADRPFIDALKWLV